MGDSIDANVHAYLQGLSNGMTDDPNKDTIEALEETESAIRTGNVIPFTGGTKEFLDKQGEEKCERDNSKKTKLSDKRRNFLKTAGKIDIDEETVNDFRIF